MRRRSHSFLLPLATIASRSGVKRAFHESMRPRTRTTPRMARISLPPPPCICVRSFDLLFRCSR
ncbi:hypothetical protein B1810_10825 [Panacagrimonas perspica]|nr:hypothetical protein B1810_10825 [Panacagrimonas perspica]